MDEARDVDTDVVIVGAGLSGIAAAYYVRRRLPWARFTVLEARDEIGGTWDLFRYPGVRSDSDMHTLGYSFRPWEGDVALADGPSIRAYVRDTARTYGIDAQIRFRHRVLRASWDSRAQRYTLDIDADGARRTVTCRFLFMCSGYYNYEAGYQPQWEGRERFGGIFVHPQHWPQNLDYAGKRVLIIGSGATAVTLVPAMAAQAAHVTMLQRSPSYVVSLPARDAAARKLYRWLPRRLAHAAVRWKNVLLQMFFYNLMRRQPESTARNIKAMTCKAVGPEIDVETHFSPRYKPWDQRLCFVPDGDLFRVLRDGSASIVTGEISELTHDGVRLRDGSELGADIIVSATGLNVQLLGGMQLDVDGVEVVLRDRTSYKGMMFSGVPNFALALGYTNASWTLKCELTARYVCRLLAYMHRRRLTVCTPGEPDPSQAREPAISLSSGYIQRASADLPKQGTRAPWRLHQNYALDLMALRYGAVNDGVMNFR